MGRQVILLGLFALSACGARKKPVTQEMFNKTREAINHNLNGLSHSYDERRKFTLEQLGPPHRTESDGTAFWYTSPPPCFSYKMHADGYGSWGTDFMDLCDAWSVK